MGVDEECGGFMQGCITPMGVHKLRWHSGVSNSCMNRKMCKQKQFLGYGCAFFVIVIFINVFLRVLFFPFFPEFIIILFLSTFLFIPCWIISIAFKPLCVKGV